MAFNSKVNLSTIRYRLGLDLDFRLRRAEDFELAFQRCKDSIIAARRANNDKLAAELSAVQAEIKKRRLHSSDRKCPDCGGAKYAHAMRCQICSYIHRTMRLKIPQHATKTRK